MRQNARQVCRGISAQCNFVRRQQPRKILAAEKSVLVFALRRERIEAEKGFVDEAGMAHNETTLWQPVEKLPHQRTEIPLLRPVVGAGESRVECDIGAFGPASKLRT